MALLHLSPPTSQPLLTFLLLWDHIFLWPPVSPAAPEDSFFFFLLHSLINIGALSRASPLTLHIRLQRSHPVSFDWFSNILCFQPLTHNSKPFKVLLEP